MLDCDGPFTAVLIAVVVDRQPRIELLSHYRALLKNDLQIAGWFPETIASICKMTTVSRSMWVVMIHEEMMAGNSERVQELWHTRMSRKQKARGGTGLDLLLLILDQGGWRNRRTARFWTEVKYLIGLISKLVHNRGEKLLHRLFDRSFDLGAKQVAVWFLKTYSIAPFTDDCCILTSRHCFDMVKLLAKHLRTHPITYRGSPIFYLYDQDFCVALIACEQPLAREPVRFQVGAIRFYSSTLAFEEARNGFYLDEPIRLWHPRPARLLTMSDQSLEVSEVNPDGSLGDPIYTPIPEFLAARWREICPCQKSARSSMC